MGGAYPELGEQGEAIDMWLAAEEESFGRTLEQGMATLRELIDARRRSGVDDDRGRGGLRLHDTSASRTR